MKLPPLEDLKAQALDSLRSGDLPESRTLLSKALGLDFEDPEVLALLKYTQFWMERLANQDQGKGEFHRADHLIAMWRQFRTFTRRIGLEREDILYSFRVFVFTQVLDLLQASDSPEGARNPQILWRMGLALKMTGHFDHARKFLEYGCRLDPQNGVMLGELADIAALLNQETEAKLLFREAFFMAPEAVQIPTLESALIRLVITETVQRVGDGPALPYWIPVVGKLMGVLSATRELKASEYARLKQAIYHIEREYMEFPSHRSVIVPRLLNHYFWILDHALHQRMPREVQQEYLLKIESLDREIYQQYTK